MHIFVTGGTGFIGSHFLNSEESQGHQITAIKRGGSKPCLTLIQAPTWLEKPLDSITVDDFKGVDALVHFASPGVSPRVAPWSELIHWNVNVTLDLMIHAKAAGVKRVIIAGTFAEYGRSADRYDLIPPDAPLEPTYGYAASKAAASVAVQAFAIEQKMELGYLRIFSAFGEGQYEGNFWPALRKAALAGDDFEMTLGEQIRDYMPVEKVAQSFWNAVTSLDITPGFPYVANVGSGKPTSMKEFAEYWWKQWNASGALKYGALPYREGEVMRFVPQVTPL